MSNENIAARIATQGTNTSRHPNKNLTTLHPVSRKRGQARKGS